MAYEIPLQKLTLVAGANLTANQYRAVVVNNTGKAALAGAGSRVVGVLQNKPDNGQAAEIMVLGVTKAIYGGTVTAGAALESNASGQLVAQTTGQVVGIALESGVSGEVHPVLLHY